MNNLMDMESLVEVSRNNVIAVQNINSMLGKMSTDMATQAEQIKAINERMDIGFKGMTDKIDEFVKELPVQPSDCDRITKAKRVRIVVLLGGKDSNAYRNSSLRSRCYADIDKYMKEPYGVTSYKYIKSVKTDEVVNRINEYELPRTLRETVTYENAQQAFHPGE